MAGITLPDWAAPLFKPARYKCLYGGRGSGKSYAVADYLLIKGAQSPRRILCAREFQNSIQDSVHKLLCDRIEAMGLQSFYTMQEKEIKGANGTTFIFKGVRHNVQSIKSMAGITDLWLEEAQTVSEESWSILVPTIREPGSEIITTFNPDSEDDPTYQRMVVNPPDDAYIRKVNYQDNPFFPEELMAEMRRDRRVDPDRAAWVWDGECRSISDAQVFKGKWIVDDFDITSLGNERAGPRFMPDGPYFGSDFGFAQDPTTLIKCWIFENTLYIDYAVGGVGIDIVDTPALYNQIPDSRRYLISADSARPETISHLRNSGYNIEGASKWKGSVEDGIQVLRSFENIVIHPRCKGVIDEMRLYKFKVDRLTGDIKPIPEDKHNHYIDALRYALVKYIQGYGAADFSGW